MSGMQEDGYGEGGAQPGQPSAHGDGEAQPGRVAPWSQPGPATAPGAGQGWPPAPPHSADATAQMGGGDAPDPTSQWATERSPAWQRPTDHWGYQAPQHAEPTRAWGSPPPGWGPPQAQWGSPAPGWSSPAPGPGGPALPPAPPLAPAGPPEPAAPPALGPRKNRHGALVGG